ncbi:hypothetical protein [Ponticaulis sp.]|uniref:hypothetical protein n=1 Tax=Ponticaulis sp. TaxID=2020902 RepID=UPI000C5CEE93|nr:hypothetical protein [Ponticaulis sp.]MBN04943.1 hypothetical protein [Ponticaulis sp.]
MTRIRHAVLASLLPAFFVLGGCDLSDEIDARRAPASEADEEPAPPPVFSNETEELPEAVLAQRDALLDVLGRDSVRQLARYADQFPGFRSNYGDLSHYEHWYLLRRAGIDPVEATLQILDEPYAVKDFGAEKYFIWPDFAGRTNEELQHDRLTFSERARILTLIGEDGLERIRNGESYPGFRLAIREDGTWVYLLQDN